MQVKIEVYVDHNNMVVTNSPLVLPTMEIPKAVYEYEELVIQPRKDAADKARKWLDKAVKQKGYAHSLRPILDELELHRHAASSGSQPPIQTPTAQPAAEPSTNEATAPRAKRTRTQT